MALSELADPFEIVASALSCGRESLSMDSAMYRDHGWDSFGHIRIIMALEEAYRISIPPSDIEKYTSMSAIRELHARLMRENNRLPNNQGRK